MNLELIAEMNEYAIKAKMITNREEWYGPQELIAHGLNRTASYHITGASPDNVLALIQANRELQDEVDRLKLATEYMRTDFIRLEKEIK